MKKLFIVILGLLFCFPVFAHPGGTDGNGGHTCRTLCEEWGLSYGEYHLHDDDGNPVRTLDNNEEVFDLSFIYRQKGNILLQVESNGEAWYAFPKTGLRYYLGRPADAFEVMRKLGLGAKHDLIMNTEIFPDNLSGMILLDVEENGEAYYVNPNDKKKYYLGRPEDAFQIMREKGIGITNDNLDKLPIASDSADVL